ncbi:hypothetical protein C8Q77DRAFT_1218345 [Trametes polyzona]|nr:hypothetical protein C8Q77DRAFT_1218345 [Trametes polyzona]
MKCALDFIKLLKGASLSSPHSGLSEEVCEQLRDPPTEILEIENDDHLFSIEVYLALHNVSRECYNKMCDVLAHRFPEQKLLSYYQVKRKVELLMGIVPIVNNMCVRSCVAFPGAYVHLEQCPKCNEPRYDELKLHKKNGAKKIGHQHTYTMPLSLQMQAQYRNPEGAMAMGYLAKIVEDVLAELETTGGLKTFDDVSHGSLFWGAYAAGQIGANDDIVMLSINGAQLYRSKKSDCWIYIWVILNLGPDKRYRCKYALPGAVIPGPNHPKDLDLFLFPGLFHIWDTSKGLILLVYIFLALILADGPAMALMSEMVGHTGRHGCWIYCPLIWRQKPRLGTYYPALLKPALPYDVLGCSHGDVAPSNLEVAPHVLAADYWENEAHLFASTVSNYELRKETELSKPSIFSGLSCMFDLPGCFPLDYMHLVALNITDLFVNLWRGTISGSKQDAASLPWAIDHSAEVARAASFLPGSYDRPPCNITEKITSGYKAKEWMTYFYGYGPAMLRRVLPETYLKNYTKFVAAGQLMGKSMISKLELRCADTLACDVETEYEHLYYGRDIDLLHFVRPAVHTFCHAARQVYLTGPLPGHTQYIMERSIGDLGGEIWLPSNPFANLSERALLRCQINTLKAMVPTLDEHGPPRLPRGAVDVGADFVFLRALDFTECWVSNVKAAVFHKYLLVHGHQPAVRVDHFSFQVQKWAHLHLPNDQVARSAWKENLKPLSKICIARIVQVSIDGHLEIGEVRYYCQMAVGASLHTVALLSVFGPQDKALYKELNGTVWLAEYRGDAALQVINVNSIQVVVAMVPDTDASHRSGPSLTAFREDDK